MPHGLGEATGHASTARTNPNAAYLVAQADEFDRNARFWKKWDEAMKPRDSARLWLLRASTKLTETAENVLDGHAAVLSGDRRWLNRSGVSGRQDLRRSFRSAFSRVESALKSGKRVVKQYKLKPDPDYKG